jgi:hypothetical protein
MGFGLSLRGDASTLFINEYPVFTLKATLDGKSPETRIKLITQTLQGVELKPPLTVTATQRGIWVRHGQINVVRVTAQEAKLQGLPAMELAISWKNKIEYALGLPPLQASNNYLTVGVGGTVIGRLFGSEAQLATFSALNSDLVKLEKVLGGVKVTGLKTGDTEIRVASPNGKTRFVVKIADSAVLDAEGLEARVFGTPPSPDAVKSAVTQAIVQDMKVAPNATIEVLGVEYQSIPVGQARKIKVNVRVRAARHMTFEEPVFVSVTNLAQERTKESELWYSNIPESVSRPGPLFSADLMFGKAVRMLFHHQNATANPMTVQIVAYNVSPTPAQIMLIRGDGEPDEDPVRSGLAGAEQFLSAWLKSDSILVTIPPFSKLPINARRLGTEYVTSGLLYMNLMAGGPNSVRLQTEAVSGSDLADWEPATRSGLPWTAVKARTISSYPSTARDSLIFSKPFREVKAEYSVGGKFAFVRIGQHAIPSLDDRSSLDGNFGVLYSVRTQLSNPTVESQMVELAFEASAGYSAGLFVIDGVKLVLPRILSKQELQVKSIRLAPGETRILNLLTIPLSGSSYPATLTMRIVDQTKPQPSAMLVP